MKKWDDVHTKEQLRKRYLAYVPSLMKIAMKCGYALSLHGSCERDLDLVAVPWVKKAYSPASLVQVLERSLLGVGYWRNRKEIEIEFKRDPKPHGRKAIIILMAHLPDDFEGISGFHPQRHAMIDLSITSRI